MSYVSQFLSGSSGSAGSGGKPIGALELFPPNMGNSFTLPDGSQYLLGGVIGKSTDYPNVPSVFLKQLSPPTKLSDIGSGGVWRAMCLDPSGFPVILQSAIFNLTGYAYRITGVSTTSASDASLILNTITNYPGSWGLSVAVSNNTILIGREFTQSGYGQGPTHTYQLSLGSNTANGPLYTGSGNWQAVAASGNYWVAIPRSGSISYVGTAYDTSSQVNMTASVAWTSVAASSTRFVAVATGSTTMNYSNAIGVTTWTAGTMPSNAQWISVASNGTGFVAIAANSTAAATSANGTTWSSSSLPLNQNWSSICWAGGLGKYVAIAKGSSTGATSPDGVTWTPITLPKTANWESVIFSGTLNRLFICGSDGTGVFMSADGGVTWQEKTMPRPITFERLEYTNGGFNAYTYASGNPPSSYPFNAITARSTDGLNWTYNNAIPTSLTYGDSPVRSLGTNLGFVSGSGNSITLFYSTNNGATYTSVTVLNGFTFSIRDCDVGYNGSKYIAPISEYFDSGNSVWQPSPWVMSSNTLASGWTLVNIGPTARWRTIFAHNSTFVMAGEDASGNIVIARSPDGNTWALASYPSIPVATNTQNVSIEYDIARSLWIISMNNSAINGVLVSSDDGLTWSVQLKTYGCLVQNGTRFTAVTGTTNITYDNAQATSPYATYVHGVSIKSNTVTPVTGYCAPVYQGGTNYFLSANSIYTLDTSLWVDNRGTASENSQAFYYMRVK